MENIINTLIDYDTGLLLWLNSFHSTFFDTFMFVFSGKWVWVPMYAVLLWAVIWCYKWRTALVMTLALALVITVADQSCASLIRPIVERLRPTHTDTLSALIHTVNDYRGGRFSFPSCHAANSFALAMFSSLLFRRRLWTIFIFTWGVINSYSRIYLGVHFPGDLIVGGVIGSIAAYVIFIIAEAFLRRGGDEIECRTGYSVKIGSQTHIYSPSDVVIATGIATVVYISICAAL